MKYNLIILAFIFGLKPCHGQSVDTNKLNNYFNTLESKDKFMGSVSIYKGEKEYYQKQFGFSEISSQKRPNLQTKYRIGSISKTFTAVLVFKAIEENKIRLSETIDRYFPDIKNANKITIENLLNHSSGIHSFTDEKIKYLSYHTQAKTEEEMVKMISKYKSDFEPNSKASYSNSNYLLLSYILEKKYGKTYAQILQDKICIPLDLKDTYFRDKVSIQQNEAYSYTFNGKWIKESQTHGSIALGAGSILSTPTDLIKFSDALFNGKVLSEKHLRKMQELKDNYGMGLFQTKYYDFISYGHNGGIDGFVSMLRYFPKEKIAFAVTSNGLNYDFNLIEIAVAKSIFNKHYDIPVFTTYTPKIKELNKYLGVYSSTSFPVKIKVSKQRKQLVLNVKGQQSIKLEAYEKRKFKFDKAGIRIEFIPDRKEMLISQGGKTNTLKKE